ncbi:unnamed protein product [Coffea canephora]|uniref:Uncharacterized protein n=1 Tax=Coffea canephora TaxID=49390 RepID=A0A068TR58_COFCA|nr:unnamed protein product [Coffea canephora]
MRNNCEDYPAKCSVYADLRRKMLEEPSRCHKTAAARGGCFRGYHPLPCTVWFGALTLQQTPNTPPPPPKRNPKTKKNVANRLPI